jgi:hypothetical protein
MDLLQGRHCREFQSATGVQWYTNYGMMHYRGNITKNKVAKGKKIPQSGSESDVSEVEKDQSNPYTNFEASERTLRVHTNKGRRDDTKQEQFSTKKIKVGHDLGDETFFMDDGKKKKIGDDLTGETFFMDEVKLETPSAQKGDVHELCSDTEEDEVEEIEASSHKKISAPKIKETSTSSQIFHGHTPQRLASPMKTSKKQTPTQPMGGSKMPPPWFDAFLKNFTESMKETVKESVENMKENVVDSVRDLVKDEIENARLKPEQNKKDDEKEEVKEDK